MATSKTGFDFYRIDTDRYQDIRIKKLKKNHGCSGIAVYDYVLCEIYRVKGCFMEWDESTAFDVAEYFGLKENTVNEIMRYCASVGLFDKELLSRGIITSSAIQKRFTAMCRSARRQQAEIPEPYRIITVEQQQEQPPQPIAQASPPPTQPQQSIGSAGAGRTTPRSVSSDTVAATTPKEQAPPQQQTVTIQDLINYVDDDDYWEAMRLSSCGKTAIVTDTILQWIREKRQGAPRYEFYEIIQSFQRLENNGQLATEQPNRFLWRAMVDIRKAYGVFTAKQIHELYSLAPTCPNDFIAAVNEWKKNRSRINAPYQFIKSKLKQPN